MRPVFIASFVVSLAHAGCVAISSDRILARDVRDSWPPLQVLDPDTVIGFAPRPGVQRILSARELILIAQKHALDTGPSIVPSICIERLVRPISPEEMRAA